MATGAEHYAQSERYLAAAEQMILELKENAKDPHLSDAVQVLSTTLSTASAHATLALAAATQKAAVYAHGVDDEGYR